MPASYELPEPLRTGNVPTDKNFKKVFKRLRQMIGVSARASSTLKFYPFGEQHDVYIEYTPSTALWQIWIGGVSKGRLNVP